MKGLNKKGVTLEGAIITIVVFGVIMIIFILLYKYLFSFAKAQFTQQECQASLLLTKAADVREKTFCIAPVDNPVPLKCSRRFITVETDGVKKDMAFLEYTPACPDGTTSCIGHNVIAKEMAHCWETFFEGEQVLFQQIEQNGLASAIGYWGPQGTACFVCSEITLRKDVSGFTEYIKSTKVKRNESRTYYEYFNTRKAWCAPRYGDACWTEYARTAPHIIDQDSFKKDQKYAVVFIREGLSSCQSDDRGDSSVTFTVQAVPANDISTYCNTVLA